MHAVSVLAQWSARLTVEVPTALLDWLKKAFTLKTSTSLVRHAYLQAMLGAFRGWSHDCHRASGSDPAAEHGPHTSSSRFQATLCPKPATSSRCFSKL